MSQENVERLRHIYKTPLARALLTREWIAPDVVLIQPDELGGGAGVYHGFQGLVRAARELTETWQDFRFEPEEFFDLGDQVLAVVRMRGRARGSGVPLDEPVAHLVTFREDLISKWEAFPHRDEALKAAGLSEQGGEKS